MAEVDFEAVYMVHVRRCDSCRSPGPDNRYHRCEDGKQMLRAAKEYAA